MLKANDEQLISEYNKLKSVWKVAEVFGMCGQSVHKRLSKIGAIYDDKWTKEEDLLLKQLYGAYKESFFIESISKEMKRSKAAIACRANELGITDRTRPKSEVSKKIISEKAKLRIKEVGHPKGMTGKKHSEETKKTLREKSTEISNSRTKEYYNLRAEASNITRIKNGTTNRVALQSNPYSRSKSGRRDDLGGQFFRSRAEANYARYLNFLKIKWEYEPKTFIFGKIRRGNTSYTPDFYLPETDSWVEIKGWFDEKSEIKIRRFEKCYPNEFSRFKIIAQSKKTIQKCVDLGILYEDYYAIHKTAKSVIKFWE